MSGVFPTTPAILPRIGDLSSFLIGRTRRKRASRKHRPCLPSRLRPNMGRDRIAPPDAPVVNLVLFGPACSALWAEWAVKEAWPPPPSLAQHCKARSPPAEPCAMRGETSRLLAPKTNAGRRPVLHASRSGRSRRPRPAWRPWTIPIVQGAAIGGIRFVQLPRKTDTDQQTSAEQAQNGYLWPHNRAETRPFGTTWPARRWAVETTQNPTNIVVTAETAGAGRPRWGN